MQALAPILTEALLNSYIRDGYFIVRQLVPEYTVDAIRDQIHQVMSGPYAPGSHLELENEVRLGRAPAVEAEARFRKISRWARTSPLVWEQFLAGPMTASLLRSFLGDEVLLKFDSVFTKPAKTGGETPWHQDIGLWRDTDHTAFNAWLAIDPATKQNGCLRVVPGSHRGPIIEHVLEEGDVHRHLPSNLLQDLKAEPVELAPGDCVFWHAHLWHGSPPNRSSRSRIGIGAVWSNQAYPLSRDAKCGYPPILHGGLRCAFPEPSADTAK